MHFSKIKTIQNFGLNYLFICLFLGLYQPVFSQNKKKDYLVTIHTKFGNMNLVLFDKTPKHKANFLKLVNDKFYDSTLFHRVIKNFMIQGGDPKSKKAKLGELLGSGDIGYKIPAEFLPDLYHKKGALAAAGNNFPATESSGCQFYIVHGKIWNETDLEAQIKRSGRPFTDLQKSTYKSIGGSPHLDGNYTVFGQLIGGYAVLDSIANSKTSTNPKDRPLTDLKMTVTVQNLKKKKILKKYADKSVIQKYDDLNL
jgi:cyclophilin family peptidyl-prolyl cis-trans isomerase